MNYIQKQRNKERLLDWISPISKNKQGFLNVCINNSPEHELTKYLIFSKLKRNGFLVWSEVLFNNNSKKADIVAIKEGTGWIIEVLHTETDEDFNSKIDSYPMDFDLISVKTKDFNIERFDI